MRTRAISSALSCLVVTVFGVALAAGQDKPDPLPRPQDDSKPKDMSQSRPILALPGVISPARQVRVSPRVSGQILEVLVEEGSRVKAGQMLIRLERTPFELEVKRSHAEVDRAQALLAEEESKASGHEEQIKQAEATVQLAAAQRAYLKAEAQRLQALVKTGASSSELAREKETQLRVADATLLQAESNLRLMQKSSQKQRIAAARAALVAAEAQRDLALLRLENADIRSPMDGTVLAKHVQVGETVHAGPLANGHVFNVCEIADLSQLDAVIEVPEGAVGKVAVGQKCEIRPAALLHVVYQGQVSKIMPTISLQTRTTTVRVRMALPNDDHSLRPGMTAEVRLLAKE